MFLQDTVEQQGPHRQGHIRTTLEAVPPGQQAKSTRPADSSGERPNIRAIAAPASGMIAYWAAHPKNICQIAHERMNE